ncbi:MAG: (2Fe-2S)-binding protein [Myxococcota bacterium]
MNVTITLNGSEFSADVEPRTLLVHFIRETANLTGTHIGCDSSNCGACTVLVDGIPIKSCTYLAAMANGKAVTTVEGLKQGGKLHPIQEQFREQHALQCGYCTPGMMLTGKSIIERYPNPTEEQIRWEISGQLCRCTGYQNIVKAIQAAAAQSRGESTESI